MARELAIPPFEDIHYSSLADEFALYQRLI